MKMTETINELAAALSKAQGMFSAAERGHLATVNSKKGEGSSYKYLYADLAAYLDVCREPLSVNGLSFVQNVLVDGAKVSVVTLLLHSSGQSIEFDPVTLNAADMMPQSIGSIITYCRRYSLSAATGMASEADDDANSGSGNNAETGQKENNLPPCPNCDKGNKAVIVGKEEYGGGLLCFSKKGGCGHKWHPTEPPRDEKKTAEQKTDTESAPLTEAEKLQVAEILDALPTLKTRGEYKSFIDEHVRNKSTAVQSALSPHCIKRRDELQEAA